MIRVGLWQVRGHYEIVGKPHFRKNVLSSVWITFPELRRLEAFGHYPFSFLAGHLQENIVAIRIYLSALTLVFLFMAWRNHGPSLLEGMVVTCALIYLILDTREYLHSARADFEKLQELEEKLTGVLR